MTLFIYRAPDLTVQRVNYHQASLVNRLGGRSYPPTSQATVRMQSWRLPQSGLDYFTALTFCGLQLPFNSFSISSSISANCSANSAIAQPARPPRGKMQIFPKVMPDLLSQLAVSYWASTACRRLSLFRFAPCSAHPFIPRGKPRGIQLRISLNPTEF